MVPLEKLQIAIDLAAILFMLIRWANVWLDSACFNYPKKVCSQLLLKMLLKVTFLKNLTSLSKVQPIPYAFYDQNDWHFNFNFIYHFLNISSIRYLFIAMDICYHVVHNAQQEIQLLIKYFFNIVAVVYF